MVALFWVQPRKVITVSLLFHGLKKHYKAGKYNTKQRKILKKNYSVKQRTVLRGKKC